MNQLTTNQGFAPTTLTEAMSFAQMLAKSQMVPRAYQGKPEDVLVAMQWGRELGLAPLQALQNISTINGKPSLYGDAAMALVQASLVCEDVEEFFEGEGTPNPVAVCVAQRKGRKPVKATFSVEDAKRAGLWGKQGPWQAYPKRMLQMRARGFALRDAFPDVLKGLITAEEASDYQPERDVTPKPQALPRNPLDAIAPLAIEDDGQRAHVEIEEVNAQLQEAAEEVAQEPLGEMVKATIEEAGIEVVEIEEVKGFALRAPGKDEPHSLHPDLLAWSAAYEVLADKVAKATKATPRDRMSALKKLREANEVTINRIDPIERVKHTAAYSKRLAALGAAMEKEVPA
jgi:hypothetical protein